QDDGYHVSGGGISEQMVYTYNDYLSFGLRGEVWDDGKGYFVAAFPGNHDFVSNELGLAASANGVPNTSIFSNQHTTYGALTFGMNWKPKVPALTKTFYVLLRPEVRVDTALNGVNTFILNAANMPTQKSQVSVGLDAIFGF
ncbi:MAG: outer membrane beta-barrel protein, partial [Alphaproteobacteria bacterium]|nr:outer membrane beta-barrel protein [Alphaproteobacteria bacterium]